MRFIVLISLGAFGLLATDSNFAHYHFSDIRRGVTGGVGIEFQTRYVTISPEVRYSRPANVYPRDNRVTGLVGFTFGGKR